MDEHDAWEQHYSQGSTYADLSNFSQALEKFACALALRPEDSTTLCQMARCCYSLDNLDEATQFAKRGASAAPTSEWPQRLLSAIHSNKGQHKAAYRFAQQAAQLAPEQVYPLDTLGTAALNLGRTEEAQFLGELLRRNHPENTIGHWLLYKVANHRKQYRIARTHLLRVLELNPLDQPALEALAVIEHYYQKFADSIELQKGSLSLNPMRAGSQLQLSSFLTSFSLFGRPFQRLQSVAVAVTVFVLLYTAAGRFWYTSVSPGDWEQFEFLFWCGMPLPLAAVFWSGRRRFLALEGLTHTDRALWREMWRQWRNVIVSSMVILNVIAFLLFAMHSDSSAFLITFFLVLFFCWIFALGIPFWLTAIVLSDFWSWVNRNRISDEGLTPSELAMLTITVTCAMLAFYHMAFFVLFLCVGVVTGYQLQSRSPIATYLAVCGISATGIAMDFALSAPHEPLSYGALAIATLTIGVVGMISVASAALSRGSQRRRISRLLNV